MLGAVGVIAIETNVAGVTVSVTGPEVTEPTTAVMVVLPALSGAAKPLDPDALLIDATDVAEEAHVAVVVRFWAELSV